MNTFQGSSASPQLGIEKSFEAIEHPSGSRFSEEFYRRMFKRFPELKGNFSGVILAHQGALLVSALGIIAQSYSQMRPNVSEYLRVLGHRHHQRGISADDYAKFQAALLETLATHLNDKWCEELEQQWQTAIQNAIDIMLLGHRDGQVVY